LGFNNIAGLAPGANFGIRDKSYGLFQLIYAIVFREINVAGEYMDLFEGLEAFGIECVDKSELYEKEKKIVLKSEIATSSVVDVNKIILQKKFSCPVCRVNFSNWDVYLHRIRLEKTDSELRKHFSPYDPLYYAAIICTSCGYGAMRNNFDQISPKQVKLVKENITPKFKAKEYPQIYTVDMAIERYKLVLYNAVIKEGTASEKAVICHRLSWLFRDKGDAENEKIFRENALKGFVHAYSTERLPIAGMGAQTFEYLIGELYRRLGNLEEAVRYISMAIMRQRGASPKIKELALDAKELIIQERNAREQQGENDAKTE